MIRKKLKKTVEHKSFKEIIKKYKIPKDYLSANHNLILRAIFLGVFIAFIPMPMQMLFVLFFIPFFKFNVPIAIAMCWITNPISMPFIYYIEYTTGSFLLNIKIEKVQLTLEWFTNNFDNIFIPLYTGAFLYSILFSTLSYIIAKQLWFQSVLKCRKIPFFKRKK